MDPLRRPFDERSTPSRPRFASSLVRGLLSLLALSMVLSVNDSPASATVLHAYSTSRESSAGVLYSGMQHVHTDVAVYNQPATGCSQYFTGEPVYQTSWVLLNSPYFDWLEFGTAHQCNDGLKFWFWGYGEQGIWHPLGISCCIANGGTNTFTMNYVSSTGRWQWLFSGTYLTDIYWPVRGKYVEQGLESYSQAATVYYYGDSSLQYKYSTGGWQSWAGNDSSSVGTGMCGYWTGATTWNAGKANVC